MYLGLDLGTKTLGISKSMGIVATNYKTIRHDMDFDYLISEIKKIVLEDNIQKIILGFPKNMNNTLSKMTNLVIEFKEKIEKEIQVEVILEDERLTSKISNDLLISDNLTRKKRKEKVDGVASTIILQSYLDRKERI